MDVSALPRDDLEAAIEQAYRQDFARFLRLATAMLGDSDRGRDAVQETFARALRSRAALRDPQRLGGWLWRTVVNVCLVEKRRPRDYATAAETAAAAAGDWPEVRAAVAALPERQRTVLFLRHYADLDYAQIAHVLGIERGTVAATLHVAHTKVRDAIKEAHDE
jgi:RNA polymerase sigma-70 factor (ECF subfamily)